MSVPKPEPGAYDNPFWWCPECEDRHAVSLDCAAGRRLSRALDAFCEAYGQGCTWRDVIGLVTDGMVEPIVQAAERVVAESGNRACLEGEPPSRHVSGPSFAALMRALRTRTGC